jgi:AcrR family transcriptional regulator
MCTLYAYITRKKYAVSTSKKNHYHHGNLRQTLLDLARKHLEREGANLLSLRSLAQEAGVSTMAPYRHFTDHSDLISNVASIGFSELRERMIRANHKDPKRAVAGFAGAYVSYALEHPGMFHLMYGSGIPTPEAGQAEDEATVMGLISQRLAEIVPEERLAEARLAGWAMIHGLATLIVQGRLRTPLKNVLAATDRMTKIVLNGLIHNT